MRVVRDRTTVLASVVVVVVVGLGFLLQSKITTAAFDRLEAAQIGQDADRVRIALDDEVRLLRGYGATNALWDDSYEAIRRTDRALFVEDFPPRSTRAT